MKMVEYFIIDIDIDNFKICGNIKYCHMTIQESWGVQ